MKYLPKAILCTIIGFVIWFAGAEILGLLVAFIVSKIPVFARFFLWLENSYVLGHLVPVFFPRPPMFACRLCYCQNLPR